jgi:hypothetical protein
LRCSASKTDPALLLCDETIAIGASPESAVATLTAHFSKATAAPPPPLPSLPPFGQVRTVLNVLVVTSALDVHALPMEVILRDDITRVGTSKEAVRVVELLGGHTQVYVTRCTDGRLLFLARTPGLARALMHAGLLWTAEVAPTTQAALLFPVSLESKIVMGRAVQAVLFGTHATIAVHNLDPDLMGPVADAWSPAAALGVPTSTDPDRAMLTEHLVGRAWTEQTRRAALETMRRHVQDQVAWQRYCEALQAMDDARQTAELFILVNALFGNVTRDVFRGVDEYVCKFLGM